MPPADHGGGPDAGWLLAIAPAPITTTGHVATLPTDLVFVLVAEADPATPGLALGLGDQLRLTLPPAFARNPAVPISADTDGNVVLTKGWPQGAVRLAGQYQIGWDDAGHSLTVTAVADVPATGANAPGIKVLHLRGDTFINPTAGDYPVQIDHVRSGGVAARWRGTASIVERPPAARLAPSNFHLPPGTGANFQQAAPGQVLPHRLGLLLWADGVPLEGVGVAARDLQRFPTYTGGLLVADTSGDRVLDPAVDRVVGGIIGSAPAGASGQAATSPRGADGAPLLSGQAVRDPGFPRGGGAPVPGLLVIEFRLGSAPGAYQPTFELIGGNRVQFTLRAAPPTE